MKRISYSSLAFAGLLALGLLAGGIAFAANGLDCAAPVHTPDANGAVITTRVFNDCPGSNLSFGNNYPQNIWIRDGDEGCTGTNLHVWSFSEDGGISPAVFENCSHYRYNCTFIITGTGNNVEGGLRVSPWWSLDVDGRFMCNATSGEIACFGGRLPFYSFTAAYGLRYVPGTPIYMEISYNPHSLTSADPATITYGLTYGGVPYSSGPLAYDEGNPAEAAEHGSWGELYPTRVGGYVQLPNWNGGAAYDRQASWWDITYFKDYYATPTTNTTWGQLTTLYR